MQVPLTGHDIFVGIATLLQVSAWPAAGESGRTPKSVEMMGGFDNGLLPRPSLAHLPIAGIRVVARLLAMLFALRGGDETGDSQVGFVFHLLLYPIVP